MEAARTLKVDPGTVYNHATRLNLLRWAKRGRIKEPPAPGEDLCLVHRRTWLKHQKDNPDASRTELRRALAGTYTWLYRHDREWLKEHQPKSCPRAQDCKARVNWAGRDDALVSQVAAAVEQLKTRSDPLIRASATAVGRELGCLSWLQKHPEKIPKTRDMISALAEDRTAFACRRLLHIWDSFGAAGIQPKPWELLRQARIRDDMTKHPVIQSLIERLVSEGGRDDILGLIMTLNGESGLSPRIAWSLCIGCNPLHGPDKSPVENQGRVPGWEQPCGHRSLLGCSPIASLRP